MKGFQFEHEVIWAALPVLLKGLELTVFIAVTGIVAGFLLGVILGLAKIARHATFRRMATGYIEAVRGTPLMVQVMFLYFGLPLMLGCRIPPLLAGIMAIAVNSGAYIAEIVRGAIQSIALGQVEAGRSLGLTRFQTMLYVVWPQAFRRMVPPLGNQFIISLKDTSILVVIGVGELTRQGQEIVAVNFRAFEVWLAVAILYLLLNLAIARGLHVIEERWLSPEHHR